MTWVVEQLHRDGSILARVALSNRHDSLEVETQAQANLATLRIGRALDNDLVLEDPHSAAHHAELQMDADGRVSLRDLGTQNGIIAARSKRAQVVHFSENIATEQIYRIGHSLIRVRNSAWPLAPEQTLSRRAVWPYALLTVALVILHGAWRIWLRDVNQNSPAYLYDLSGQVALFCIWSGIYALFGRLISGNERFFSHLLIACIGYLSGTLILHLLDVIAFAMSWLWPIRIVQPVIVIVAAMTVRAHLRLADVRHWPTLRYAVALVATIAVIIPIGQHWISRQRLTDVQTMGLIEHPSLRLAKPITVEAFSMAGAALKERVDNARKKQDEGEDGTEYESEF